MRKNFVGEQLNSPHVIGTFFFDKEHNFEQNIGVFGHEDIVRLVSRMDPVSGPSHVVIECSVFPFGVLIGEVDGFAPAEISGVIPHACNAAFMQWAPAFSKTKYRVAYRHGDQAATKPA